MYKYARLKKFATKTILDIFELVFQIFLYWNYRWKS